MSSRALYSALSALLLLLIASCAPSARVANVSTTPPPERMQGDYRIGVPDLLYIRVWEQDDLSGEVLVRRDGKVSVPLIGDVVAEGLTPEALAAVVGKELAQFVNEPRVDVAVVEMRSQVVSVIGGGVQRSGVVELRHNMRVIDAIAEMGGLTPFARKREIRVLRNTADGEQSYLFDYVAFMRGEAPAANFPLAAGDTIVVPE
ncbi:MAG: polysaccharide biosynthesis/export family protein [Pseudomonadota bacterium]